MSHLGGQNSAASVVSFRDGRPDPRGHRRYDLDEAADGVAPGDDPAGVFAATARRCREAAEARERRSGKRAAADRGDDDRDALPDLLVIDGGAAQLVAAARALAEAGVVVSNLREAEAEAEGARGDDVPALGVPGGHRAVYEIRVGASRESGAFPAAPSVALASLAKGRASGERSCTSPAPRVAASSDDDAFASGSGSGSGSELGLGLGPRADGFEAVAVSVPRRGADGGRGRGGRRRARARAPAPVRDEAHAVALGAHRRRRRSSLFGEIADARQRAAEEDEEEDAARVAAG